MIELNLGDIKPDKPHYSLPDTHNCEEAGCHIPSLKNGVRKLIDEISHKNPTESI